MKLEHLIDHIMEILSKRGYTEKTWKFAFRNGRFSSIRNYFEAHGTDEFDVKLANGYIAEIQQTYETGQLSYDRAAHLKKLARWFIEVYETGELQQKQSIRKISIYPCFEAVFYKYMDSIRDILSLQNVEGQKSIVLDFLEFLQNEKGYSNFLTLSLKDIQEFILFKRPRFKGRMDFVTHVVKRFVSYLQETNIIYEDLTPALYMQAPKVTKILNGFSHEEVDRILAQPDRNTPIGKRDYAILLLGRNTGLRIGDIVNLEFTNINWQKDELIVTQQKTGNRLILPLEPETENSIADYIRNGRPKCNLPYIFLRHNAPLNALSRQSVTVLFTKYRTDAGILATYHDGKSFHGLRRSIARWMLEAEIPLTTISQILGHRDLDSAVPYLSFDESKLRLCGLSLYGIEVTKEGLM